MESKNRSYLSELCIFNLVKCCWGMPVLRCKRACFATEKVAYYSPKGGIFRCKKACIAA